MNEYPTIYKRTSGGKIQIWYAEIDNDRYRTVSGQEDGKKVVSEWTYAKPKNVGKSNATTAEEQAIAQVEAIYEKRLARDYRRSIEDVDIPLYFSPMTALKWQDRKNKIEDKVVYIQPKLDGMRCIAKADGLWSREGKLILGVPHINECLAKLFENNPDLILDGELYNHAFKDDFNSIISACKKQTPTEEEKANARNVIQYHVYDVPSEDKFADRFDYLYSLPFDNEYLHKVETLMIDIDHVDGFADAFIEDGYEGAMIRLNAPYENKRSKSLIKWKEMTDEEFPIIEVLEGEGGRAGIAASVVCGLGDGSTFRAGIIGNVDFCREMLNEKEQYIGKLATIVFQNYTPDGKPRFAKFKAVRDYE